MDFKDLVLNKLYMCKDYGLSRYVGSFGLYKTFKHINPQQYGDETAYDYDDVQECIRELTILERELAGEEDNA